GPGRATQTLDVLAETEDGGAVRGSVGPDPFEDGGPVVEGVGQEVDLGVVPGNHLTVHPDGGGVLHPAIVPRGTGSPHPTGVSGSASASPGWSRGAPRDAWACHSERVRAPPQGTARTRRSLRCGARRRSTAQLVRWDNDGPLRSG